MKLLFSSFLLLISVIIHGQDEISNNTYPFQVLFVDSATLIGKDEPIKQYDFVGKYELVQNYGELVLIHYSGEIHKTSQSTLRIREICKKYSSKPWNGIQRPEISRTVDSQLTTLDSIPFRSRLNSEGAAFICGTPHIQILYPEIIDAYASIPAFKDSINLVWKSEEYIDEFLVRLVNIFDEEIFLVKTTSNQITIPRNKLDSTELTLFEVRSVNEEFTSGVFALHFLEKNKDDSYNKLLGALQLQWDQPFVAKEYFIESIRLSENDPRFIKLYQDFLERNPEFK